MKFRLWPVNLSVTVTRLDVLPLHLGAGARKVCKAICEQVLEDSKTIPPMVPVDTGDLESTGRVEKSTGGWAVVYGGESNGQFVDYANQVHDDLRPRHYKKPGSGPKFVEYHYLRRTSVSGPEFDENLSRVAERLFAAGAIPSLPGEGSD